jgi:hypothetical protein
VHHHPQSHIARVAHPHPTKLISRRIAEAWTDYIVTQSGGVTIASAIAAQAAQDAAAGQEQSSTSSLLEGEQIEFEEPVGGTTIVIKPITNLSRQYI